MTSSHDALYRAICAYPDEDTPRLAFADLIEEAGDSDRAHFIRAQIALSQVPIYDPLWVKARQFDPDAATGWCQTNTLPNLPAGYGWHRFEFRRGFPWKVGVLSLEAFVSGGEAIFECAPIQALSMDARTRPDFDVLADWPHLARLDRLEVSVGWLGSASIAQLTDSPFATNITELEFEFDGVTAEGLTALAASPLFERLRVLELRSNAIPSALLVDALAAAREPTALSRLSLPNNRIGRDDAAHLFALSVMSAIEYLDISDNPLGVDGVQALAKSGSVRGLRVLNLCKTNPGVPGIKSLTEASGLAGLRMLDLSTNRLGPVAVKLIGSCGGFRGLRVLNLAYNPVGDIGAATLAKSSSLAGLHELDLRGADIGNAGAIALAESPHLENLLRLDLRPVERRSFSSKARAALVERFGDRVSL
ncbi:MAG: TIGR02996 domain-containing protein [Planctomycetia bacterium]|nr:TIGR02996 domain-containing protein [Planctomycetia bacterium]